MKICNLVSNNVTRNKKKLSKIITNPRKTTELFAIKLYERRPIIIQKSPKN